MFRRSSILGALIASASLAAFADSSPIIISGDDREPKGRRAPQRIRRSSAYHPKTPATAADHGAIALAEMKRVWRGAKRRRDAEATAAGYYFARQA